MQRSSAWAGYLNICMLSVRTILSPAAYLLSSQLTGAACHCRCRAIHETDTLRITLLALLCVEACVLATVSLFYLMRLLRQVGAWCYVSYAMYELVHAPSSGLPTLCILQHGMHVALSKLVSGRPQDVPGILAYHPQQHT